MIGLRSRVVSCVEVSELVVWAELFVGSVSAMSRKSSTGRLVTTSGKMSFAGPKIMSCFCWYGMLRHTRMLDDNVVPNTDLCVRVHSGTPITYGSGVNEVETSGVAVGGAVRGSDINTCSEALKKNRIYEKDKRHERGLILYSPVT